MQASEAVAELQAENKRLAGLLSEAEVAAEGAAQLRDALEAKNEAEVLQVCSPDPLGLLYFSSDLVLQMQVLGIELPVQS